MVTSKEGRLLTKEGEVKARWQEHFIEVSNRPVPEDAAQVGETNVVNDSIDIEDITRKEIRSALGDMKSGKVPGIESITADLLKVDTDTTVNILHGLFNTIWKEEIVPEDWSRGLIIKLQKKGDLASCGNWRGITLMSIVAKVLGRVLIKRIVAGTDAELRREQTGSQVMNTNCTSAVVDGDGRTNWFEVKLGVK